MQNDFNRMDENRKQIDAFCHGMSVSWIKNCWKLRLFSLILGKTSTRHVQDKQQKIVHIPRNYIKTPNKSWQFWSIEKAS